MSEVIQANDLKKIFIKGDSADQGLLSKSTFNKILTDNHLGVSNIWKVKRWWFKYCF